MIGRKTTPALDMPHYSGTLSSSRSAPGTRSRSLLQEFADERSAPKGRAVQGHKDLLNLSGVARGRRAGARPRSRGNASELDPIVINSRRDPKQRRAAKGQYSGGGCWEADATSIGVGGRANVVVGRQKRKHAIPKTRAPANYFSIFSKVKNQKKSSERYCRTSARASSPLATRHRESRSAGSDRQAFEGNTIQQRVLSVPVDLAASSGPGARVGETNYSDKEKAQTRLFKYKIAQAQSEAGVQAAK